MEQAFGKYQLIRKLATGGMAEVFLARSAGPSGFEKILVLKRVLPHLAEDTKFVQMFVQEAKLAAQLNHPSVVQIFDLGQREGEYFLAMEYIDGPTLRAVIRAAEQKRLALPIAFCAKVASLACEGLAYAHDFCDPNTGQWLGLVHRDVSPENILIARSGAVKVVDFGIAKAAAVSQTKSHSLRGKYGYLAPEQLRKRNVLDRRVDVYALGVVLYELVTGHRPFDAVGEVAIMRAILSERIVPASRRRADVPPMLDRIFEKALGRREDRYPSCHELHADLERLVQAFGGMTALKLARVVAELEILPRGLTGQHNAQQPAGAPGVTRTAASLFEMGTVPLASESTPPGPPAAQTRLFDPHVQATVEQGVDATEIRPAPTFLAPPLPAQPTAEIAEAAEPGLLTANDLLTRERARHGIWARFVLAVLAGISIGVLTIAVSVWRAEPVPVAVHPVRVAAAPGGSTAPVALSAPEMARIRIESTLAGELRLNGRLVGFTPVTLESVPAGSIHLQVSDSRLGFSREEELIVSPGDNGTHLVRVERVPVAFKLPRGTEVFLDGERVGTAPLREVSTFEGPHLIRMESHGQTREAQLRVARGTANIVEW